MNKEFNDIESYRKLRKKKMRKRRLITLAVILFLVLCLFFTFSYFLNLDIFGTSSSNTGLSSGNKPVSEGFPVSLEGESGRDVSSLGGLISLLTDTKVAIYTDSGKWIGSDAHGFANPVIRTTSKRILIYDEGGYDFKIMSKNEVIAKKTLTDKIVFAKISNEGYIAVATQNDHYYGCLTIYDSKLEEIFKWSSASNQLVDMEFFDGSNKCAVLGYTAENGGMVSKAILLDFSSEDVQLEKSFKDILGLSIDVKNSGNITVVGDTALYVIDQKGNDIGSYTYNKQLSFVANEPTNYTVLSLTNPNSRDNSEAVVFDDEGKKIGSYTVEKRIKDVISDGSRVLLLGADKVYNLDMSLKLLNTIECPSDAKRIVFLGSYIYILNSDNIIKNKVE